MANEKDESDPFDLVPQRTVQLIDSDQVKAYVHPARITILGLLAKEKRTISGIARELVVHPANITHHFKLLEKTGLIQLVEKRDIGKTIEKYYRAVAYSYIVKLKKQTTANKKALALSILKDDLSVAAGAIGKDDKRPVIALLKTARLKEKDAILFSRRLKKLVDEFANHESDEGTPYNINLSLYPGDAVYAPQKEITIG